jgi:hypothetical protein
MSSDREQHIVKITKNTGERDRDELVAYINKHLAEHKGTQDGGATEESHGVPILVFKTSGEAHVFANEMSKATNYPREHIEVMPRIIKTSSGRRDGKT